MTSHTGAESAPQTYTLPTESPIWVPYGINSQRADNRYFTLGCGDDRWPHGGIQMLGGAYALGHAVTTAKELRGDSSDIPVSAVTKSMVDTLEMLNILGLNHEGCAGAAGLEAISTTGVYLPGKESDDTVTRQRAAVWGNVQRISSMSSDRFERVIDTMGSVTMRRVGSFADAEAYMLARPERNGEHYFHLHGRGFQPTLGVSRVPIGNKQHEASLIAVNDDPGHAFDGPAAWDLGLKAYHFGRGQVGNVATRIRDKIDNGVSVEDVLDVATVYTAQAALHLPSPNGHPLRLQHLGRVVAQR